MHLSRPGSPAGLCSDFGSLRHAHQPNIVPHLAFALFACALLSAGVAGAQTIPAGTLLASSRPVPVGKAPGMQVRQIKSAPDERVYVVIFHAGDEAMSGLTDFAVANKIEDAHFTAIGAASGATVAWLDPAVKKYRAIPVAGQHEVLSLIGDIGVANGKPSVHMHTVLGGKDGAAVGGHVFELYIYPTLEVFVTVGTTPLHKKVDPASEQTLFAPAE